MVLKCRNDFTTISPRVTPHYIWWRIRVKAEIMTMNNGKGESRTNEEESLTVSSTGGSVFSETEVLCQTELFSILRQFTRDNLMPSFGQYMKIRSLVMKGSHSVVTTISDSIQIAQVFKSSNFTSVHTSSVYYTCKSD